jgi:hypothetical protein
LPDAPGPTITTRSILLTQFRADCRLGVVVTVNRIEEKRFRQFERAV